MERPTADELEKLLREDFRNIREMFLSPSGVIFIRELKKIQSLQKMFDKDPYIMAYRCAIHDVVGRILEMTEPHDG